MNTSKPAGAAPTSRCRRLLFGTTSIWILRVPGGIRADEELEADLDRRARGLPGPSAADHRPAVRTWPRRGLRSLPRRSPRCVERDDLRRLDHLGGLIVDRRRVAWTWMNESAPKMVGAGRPGGLMTGTVGVAEEGPKPVGAMMSKPPEPMVAGRRSGSANRGWSLGRCLDRRRGRGRCWSSRRGR